MLNNNKTYDNRNLRDHLKVFNDGMAIFYYATERVMKDEKVKHYFSYESISYNSYLQAAQNNTTIDMAIGIPCGGVQIVHGDACVINGDEYQVDHVQYKNDKIPAWNKVFLKKVTVPYAKLH